MLITVVSNHIELYTLYTINLNYYAPYEVPLIGNKKLEFEETKGVIRIWTDNIIPLPKKKGTKGQTTIYKNTTQKTKDQATQTPIKTGGELRYSGRIRSSCSTSGTCHVNLVANLMISHE